MAKATAVIAPTSMAPVDLPPAAESVVEDSVREKLRDPESAQFSSMRAFKGDGRLIGVCGLVNAKNGFGGYVGETPFFTWYGVTPEGKYFGLPAFIAPMDADYKLQVFFEAVPVCSYLGL